MKPYASFSVPVSRLASRIHVFLRVHPPVTHESFRNSSFRMGSREVDLFPALQACILRNKKATPAGCGECGLYSLEMSVMPSGSRSCPDQSVDRICAHLLQKILPLVIRVPLLSVGLQSASLESQAPSFACPSPQPQEGAQGLVGPEKTIGKRKHRKILLTVKNF